MVWCLILFWSNSVRDKKISYIFGCGIMLILVLKFKKFIWLIFFCWVFVILGMKIFLFILYIWFFYLSILLIKILLNWNFWFDGKFDWVIKLFLRYINNCLSCSYLMEGEYFINFYLVIIVVRIFVGIEY